MSVVSRLSKKTVVQHRISPAAAALNIIHQDETDVRHFGRMHQSTVPWRLLLTTQIIASCKYCCPNRLDQTDRYIRNTPSCWNIFGKRSIFNCSRHGIHRHCMMCRYLTFHFNVFNTYSVVYLILDPTDSFFHCCLCYWTVIYEGFKRHYFRPIKLEPISSPL